MMESVKLCKMYFLTELKLNGFIAHKNVCLALFLQ